MAILIILLAGWTISARPGVIITGILDGTLSGGCPKVIEIFVTGTVNLNYYEIWRSLNGAPFGSGSGSVSSMSGIFTDTFVFLVKTDHVEAFHDVFGNEGIFANVVPMGIINGNGNDGFQVRQKVGSVVIDQVWLESASYSYEDSYWYRKHGTGPDGGWNPSAWETPGNGALDELDQDGLQAAVPFGTYAACWNGFSTDWNDPGNWSPGLIPSFQSNVLVRDTASFFPVITNPPSSPATCMNLTLKDSAVLTVLSGKALTVFGDLTLESQEEQAPGYGMILASDSLTATTGSLKLYGTSSGTMFFERYISKNNDWHFLASPVDTQFFQPGFVPDPIDSTFDLYNWDEGASRDSGWINCRDANGQWNSGFGDHFIPGKGYLVAYSPSSAGSGTRTFSGTAFSGSLEIQVSHSGNSWNLLGNPYTCALDWSSNGINKDFITGGAMYVWDPALNNGQGGYRTHNGTTGVPEGTTPAIPATQGFFVESLGTGTITVDINTDDPLVHSGQAIYKAKEGPAGNRLRLKISGDAGSDETLVYFAEGASNGYDPALDASKLFAGRPGCPEICTISGDKSLCINLLSTIPVSVPVGVNCSTGGYFDLHAFDFAAIDPGTGIFLEDNLSGSWTDLRENTDYTFYYDPADEEDRFVLHFMQALVQNEGGMSILPEVWSSGNALYLSNPSNDQGFLRIYCIDGRCLLHKEFPAGKSAVRLDFPSGYYIYKAVMRQGSLTGKVFVQ